MSIFGSIMSAIFGNAQASASPVPPGVAPSAPTGSSPPPAAAGQVDVAEVLDDLEDEFDEDLDWRHSIVDLMKLLKLDSSLTARKTLAPELGYTGDMRLRVHEHLAAQAGDDQARRERRQGAGRPALKRSRAQPSATGIDRKPRKRARPPRTGSPARR